MKKLSSVAICTALICVFASCDKPKIDDPDPNIPPVAIAGEDQLILLPMEALVLDGSKSYDPDGCICTWHWTKVAGPESLVFNELEEVRATISNFEEGVYLLKLTVTDNKGVASDDYVEVQVKTS